MLTLTIPDALYQHLKERAERNQRSIEDEILAILAAALENEPIPLDIQAAVESLPTLDDAALWQVAETSHFSRAESNEVTEMLFKRARDEELTDAEKQRRADLLHRSNKMVAVRSRALALLKERGHDITPLLKIQ